VASPLDEGLFHFRPMFSLAAGFSAGILLNSVLHGAWPIWAACLLLCLFAAALRLGLKPQALFALSLALGLLRPLLGPVLPAPALMAPFLRMRATLLASSAALFGEHAPILQAMLWGYKPGISDEIYAAYRGSGIAHVLALSGLHISFVAAVADWLTRRARPKVKLRLSAIIFFTYCAIAAFPASLVRASVMSLCAIYARVTGRRYDLASSVSFAALIILLFEPFALFEIGFQLSFAAVAAIAMLMPGISRLLSGLPDSISSLLSVSICGTLGTLPLSVYYFNSIPVLGLFANVLIMPIVPFVFISALIVCLLGMFLPGAAALLAPIPIFLTGAMSAAAEMVSSVSFAVREAGVTPLCCVFLYAAYFALSDYPLLPRPHKLTACAAMLAAALLTML